MRIPIAQLSASYASRRLLSTTPLTRTATPFSSSPAPHRLPKEDQELYERLQQSSTGAFSSPKPDVIVNPTSSPSSTPSAPQRQKPQINQSSHSTPAEAEEGQEKAREKGLEEIDARVHASGRGEELHPDVRRGAKPEFEGERNPKTGEVGGPKNEPLRWGGDVDWSYNGRVTDF